jgi:RNA 2',3'-cyclic 3'-phosphodiesterase
MRAFIAINIPERIKEKVSNQLISEIQANGFSPVKKDNLHLTIMFLGDCNSSEIERVIKALKTIKRKRFCVQLDGIGEFNSRVLWLGVKKGDREIREINREISCFFEAQNEKFSPHLTLARNKNYEGNIFRITEFLSKKGFNEEFEVKSIDLMESVLSKQGASYSKIFSQELE